MPIYYAHQYFTKGTKNPTGAVSILLNEYGLNQEHQGTYRLRGDDFSLRFTGSKEFSVTLRNQNGKFVPDKRRLEFRVIGHFLRVAEPEILVHANSEPIENSIYQALLDCSDNSQPINA